MTASRLRLYNTLSKQIEEFSPRDPARITFYTCGPTVYDDAHIGNFRSFLAADLLRRFVESPLCVLSTAAGQAQRTGPVERRTVVHVMNITDVGHMTDDAEGGEAGEDRMAVAGQRLEAAKKAGKLPADVQIDPRDPYQIARYYEQRFKEDAKVLGLKLAHEFDRDSSLMPRATESIAGMITVIERLHAHGHAYTIGQPGARVVYFDINSFPAYGRLSGNTLGALRAGEGGRVSEVNQSGKRHPADFLLWKEDATHIMKWPSPFGVGYPGWHIECTAMAAAKLAPVLQGAASSSATDISTLALAPGAPLIDLHSGGEDNIFPHHECEIAQSCCAFNADAAGTPAGYASLWFHPRFLLVEGAKMSKSKGNFYTPRDLFERGVQPGALRLELIRAHYRSNANFTLRGLEDASRMLDRWRRALLAATAAAQGTTAAVSAESQPVLAAFASAMHDDLNIAEAIAEVNTYVAGLGTMTDLTRHTKDSRAEAARVVATLTAIDDVLAVLDRPVLASQTTSLGVYGPGVTPAPEIEAKLAERAQARASKDFASSDRIRDELAAMGLAIKDSAGGKVEVSRRG